MPLISLRSMVAVAKGPLDMDEKEELSALSWDGYHLGIHILSNNISHIRIANSLMWWIHGPLTCYALDGVRENTDASGKNKQLHY